MREQYKQVVGHQSSVVVRRSPSTAQVPGQPENSTTAAKERGKDRSKSRDWKPATVDRRPATASNTFALAANQNALHVVGNAAILGEGCVRTVPLGVVGVVSCGASLAVIAL